MIRHIVIWRFKEQADGFDRQTNLSRVKKELESLPERIPDTISKLEVGLNSVDNGANHDMVLIVDFDGREALERYLGHPEHLKVADLVMRVRDVRTAVDIEL